MECHTTARRRGLQRWRRSEVTATVAAARRVHTLQSSVHARAGCGKPAMAVPWVRFASSSREGGTIRFVNGATLVGGLLYSILLYKHWSSPHRVEGAWYARVYHSSSYHGRQPLYACKEFVPRRAI